MESNFFRENTERRRCRHSLRIILTLKHERVWFSLGLLSDVIFKHVRSISILVMVKFFLCISLNLDKERNKQK